MERLPSDVLHHIFSFACRLPEQFRTVALVCRRWNGLAWSCPAYLIISCRSKLQSDVELHARFPRVLGLCLEAAPQFTFLGSSSLTQQLQALDLVRANLKSISMLPLGTCSSLRRLQLPLRVGHLPPSILSQGESSSSIHQMSSSSPLLPSLRELWLNGAAELQKLPSLVLCSSLTGLNVSLFSGPTSSLHALSSLTHLKWLNISRAYNLSEADLAIITRSMRELQCLDISGCSGVRKLTWLPTLMHLRVLKMRHLNITDTDLRALKALSRLTHLDLQSCLHITDNGLLLQLAAIKSLREIDVRGTRIKLQKHHQSFTAAILH